ncbi:F-box/FBD/LRR-repeat protein At4g26340 [Quercus suber]|uniref:F-box/FBD/LRR-repeat protein At4g26340 n=1 Tax=Quercus suber TaxID=58331 RepID=UPI0032DFE90A
MRKRQTKLANIVHTNFTITHQKDRLSELSDEILVSILSTLPFMEMQRTSVLSKRWRYLWTFTTCHLDFDDSRLLTLVWKTFYQQKFSGSELDQYLMMLVNLENTEFEENSLRTRFVSWVNRALELHQGNTIDEFRVAFDMDGRKFKSEIDNWICFSLRKKVKKLSLDFMMDGVNAYTLTSQIFHSYIRFPGGKALTSPSEDIGPDRLSELSDEILVSILSTLPFMEMQRTSVLSKRWRYLWTFTTCHLDFDDSRLLTLVWKTFYQQKFSGSELDQYLMMLVNLENTEFEENSLRTRFVSWVNRALELHQGNTIDEFRVAFDMDGRKFKSEIDNWICFSLRKKVKKLSLDFMMDGVNAYTLTSQIFHSYSLDSLTALSLTYVKVTGEVLEYVLSNCPFIEILHVENSESLVNLKTSSPLPKLKNLEILNCCSLKQIQIPAINLVSFKYCGVKMIRIILGDLPYFVDLSVTGDCVRYLLEDDCPISRYLSQLETLELGLFTKEFIQFPIFPELRNLRQLKLDLCPPFMDSFRCCTSLLKAFPVLHRFVLKFIGLDGPWNGEIKVPRAKYPHQCLKVVELIGFVGCTVDMKLALYVINNAPSLEKIIIDAQIPSLEEVLHDSSNPKKLGAIHYVKQLESRLAPGVELVVL